MNGVLALATLAACGQGPADEGKAYRTALELAAREPAATWVRCRALSDPALRGDCQLAVIEAWATAEGEPTDALLARCGALDAERTRGECAFQVAERRDDPGACAAAGPFADDCRLHLFTLGMARWAPQNVDPTDPTLHVGMLAEMERVGLPRGDLRPASALFRAVLDRQPRLDRGTCQPLPRGWREACWSTGEALFHDRLNQARDQGTLPCPGALLPPALDHAPDPALDAALTQAQAGIDCGGPPR